MADDRMKNDDLQKNMGGAGRDEGQTTGHQAPGRTGQQSGQQAGQKSDVGTGQKGRDLEDDDLETGKSQTSGQNR